jgi:hypothetical protein
MDILRVQKTKILNFKFARSLLSTFFVRAARVQLYEWRLEFGGVGINDIKDRRIFSDLSQMPTILEHGFYVRAR